MVQMARVSLLPPFISGALFLILATFLSLPIGHYAEEGTLSRHCLENPPTPNSTYGAGSVKEIGGLKAYVSGRSHSKKAVILISDVYGFEAPKLRKIADKVARSGFYTVVPDFFYGDPWGANSSETFQDWLKNHGTDKGSKDAKPVISALRKEGIHAVGAAGFCWGGNVVTKLAKTHLIKAAVLLHPSWVTLDNIKAVEVPIAILAAELDDGTPRNLLDQFKEALNQNKVENFIKIYPKVQHGWTVRYNDTDAIAVKAAKEAHKDMLHWFKKYV